MKSLNSLCFFSWGFEILELTREVLTNKYHTYVFLV